MIGSDLAQYRILAHLGSGGMGEVYRATDTRLDREVALKFLPDATAQDPERLARFQREARTLASLHHPHVASLFGFEEADGVRFLVMELVEGEDLSQRLERGPLPLDEAISLMRQVARGMEAAHANGIVHRDLKPANIKISSDGSAKVLDFGLARAYADEPTAQELEHSPTITAAMTQAGVVLGTAAYMSPEQAKGKAVDQRTDVFAFGCVLYECLTARKAFEGDTVTEVLASILRSDPDWEALPAGTPAFVRRVLERCLEKDPRNRFRDIGDVELLLRDTEEAQVAEAGRERSRSNRLWPVLVTLLTVGLVLSWFRGSPEQGGGSAVVDTLTPLTDDPGLQVYPDLSPDGRQLLYSAREGGDYDIFLQRVGGENPINLTPDSPGRDTQPAFSPDGERIAFSSERAGGGVYVMGATGESPRRVHDSGYDAAWSPDGTQLVVTREHVIDPTSRSYLSWLTLIDLETEQATRIADFDCAGPSWSPSGRRIAFWSHLGTKRGQRDIWTMRPDGTDPIAVTDDIHTDWDPVWSDNGRWLYFISDRGGSPDLWRIGVDEDSGQSRGAPEPVTAGPSRLVQLSGIHNGRIAVVEYSPSGSLLALGFDPETRRPVGNPRRIHRTANPMWHLSASPDGRWVGFGTTEPTERLYLMSPDGRERRKLIDDEFRNRGLRVSPDGEWAAFYSNRSGDYRTWLIRTDGTGLKMVLHVEGAGANEPVWSPDGRLFVTAEDGTLEIPIPPGGPDAIDESVMPRPLPGGEGFYLFHWSADGSMATGIDRNGQVAIYHMATQQFEVLDDPRARPYFTGAWIGNEALVFWNQYLARAYVYELADGTFTPVEGLPGPGDYVFSPDGATLYANIHDTESEVWLLTLPGAE